MTNQNEALGELMARLGEFPESCSEFSNHPRKLVLCGSTRFRRAFLEWNRRLTLEGCIVYSVAFWSSSESSALSRGQKQLLDAIHKQKIIQSGEIFVLDVAGYIGESTVSEVRFAQSRGKVVRLLSELYPHWTEDDCEYLTADELRIYPSFKGTSFENESLRA